MGIKGETTRQTLLDAALALFAEQGFESTTMRDIADRADRSPGLAYRYFRRKEDFVFALYRRLADEAAAAAHALPEGSMALRFHAAMSDRFARLAPHRATLRVLLPLMLDPGHELGVFGEASRPALEANLAAMAEVVSGAADAPALAEAAVEALYVAHLGLQLLWFQDPSPGQASARAALDLARDLLVLVPSDHPLVPLALFRLRQVTAPLLEER